MKLLFVISFLLTSSICLSQEFEIVIFEKTKNLLLDNEQEFRDMADDFLAQNSVYSFFRRDFDKYYFDLDLHEISYDIYTDSSSFRVTLDKKEYSNENLFWEENIFENITYEGKTLKTFLNENNIDSSYYKRCINFLITQDLFALKMNSSKNNVQFEILNGIGLLYKPNITEDITGIPSTSVIKKINDQWFYFMID